MREEGEERRRQLELDAQERKAVIVERNQEEVVALQEKLAEELAAENENFAERKADLQEYYNERVTEIDEGEARGLAEIAQGLTDAEELTRTQFDELITLAGRFGEDTGKEFASGIRAGFERNLRLDELISGFSTRGINAPSVARREFTGTGGLERFQLGGIVPGASNQPRLIMAHGGEEIANPAQGQSIVIGGESFAVREASRMAAAINGQRQRDLQAFADALEEIL